MNVLHLLTAGGVGGIEILCKDIAQYSQDNNYFAFVFHGGEICNEMREQGYAVTEYNSHKFDFNVLNKLCDFCAQKHIDIIQVHHRDMFLYWFAIKIKKLNRKVKVLTTVHSCYKKGFSYPANRIVARYMMNWLVREMFRISDMVAYVSKAGYSSFLEFDRELIQNKPKVIVYNGISPLLLECGNDNALMYHGDFQLLYVGRIEDLKGIKNLILAVNHLKSKYPIKLVIAGNGSKKNEYMNLVQKLGCEQIIKFVGVLRANELDKARRAAQIFVYPSTCEEIFGISIVEAMAYGLIPVVNAVGGIPEIVDDSCAIITESNDEDGLYKALTTVFTLFIEDRAKNISQKAKERAAQFSIIHTVDTLSAIYRQMIL